MNSAFGPTAKDEWEKTKTAPARQVAKQLSSPHDRRSRPTIAVDRSMTDDALGERREAGPRRRTADRGPLARLASDNATAIPSCVAAARSISACGFSKVRVVAGLGRRRSHRRRARAERVGSRPCRVPPPCARSSLRSAGACAGPKLDRPPPSRRRSTASLRRPPGDGPATGAAGMRRRRATMNWALRSGSWGQFDPRSSISRFNGV